MQGSGSALRMRTEDLRAAIDASPLLRGKLLRYAHAVLLQTAETAMSLGFYTVNQRLARWILMSHDRADGDDLFLSHDYLSLMLGTRRSGVTVAVQCLEGEKMIKASRGHIIVQDRPKLIRLAGECYGRSKAEYERVLAA